MKTIVFRIKSDGSRIEGLWADFLSKLAGKKTVVRASNIEYDPEKNGWVITLLLPDRVQLDKVFTKRQDALAFEIEFINNLQKEGRM
jgi:hypothetical protein